MTTAAPRGIYGIGVCTLDVISVVETFPGEEGVEMAREAMTMGGGPVATALVAAASLGARATMLDHFGDDWRSRLILGELEAAGVDTSAGPVQAGGVASLATVLVRAADGARAIRFVRSTAAPLGGADIDREQLLSHRFVHCNGRHPEACLAAAELCQNSGGATSLAFDGGAGRYREDLLPLMRLADLPIVAHQFATAATGEDEVGAAAGRLAQLCPRASLIGITDGANGSWIFPRDGGAFHQPAFPVEVVVDTTGCGDVYHGAFLFALDKGWSYEKAAEAASAAGAINAAQLGGRGGLPTIDRLEEMIGGSPF